MVEKVYGPKRTKVREFIQSKAGADVTFAEIREAFPDIPETSIGTLLSTMVGTGEINRKYRGVYVANPDSTV
jgi:hypothetical protein